MFLHSRRKQDDIPEDEVRTHCISVRLNKRELEKLDGGRGFFKRGEALRMAALTDMPAPVSKLDLQAWSALSKSAGNLNQLSHKMNAGDVVSVNEIREILADFRASLLTANGGKS
jgi:hypothetical protein